MGERHEQAKALRKAAGILEGRGNWPAITALLFEEANKLDPRLPNGTIAITSTITSTQQPVELKIRQVVDGGWGHAGAVYGSKVFDYDRFTVVEVLERSGDK